MAGFSCSTRCSSAGRRWLIFGMSAPFVELTHADLLHRRGRAFRATGAVVPLPLEMRRVVHRGAQDRRLGTAQRAEGAWSPSCTGRPTRRTRSQKNTRHPGQSKAGIFLVKGLWGRTPVRYSRAAVADSLPDNPYNPSAWIFGDPEIGADVWIGAFTLIDGSGGLTIGPGCNISCGAQLLSHTTVRRCITEGAYSKIDHGKTVLGRAVFIGSNAVILPGVVLGDHVVVGANAVIGRDVPSECVVIGVPYRILTRYSPSALSKGLTAPCACAFTTTKIIHPCEEHDNDPLGETLH